ncbi:polysaccharide deacetylase family protein [Sphingobacterium bovistauri]|uniref:Polysaccharide deacetylase family protein n=1 Tax=Sphingobacterium bovistauri TaxID=2781959 RepID=A0ABS7Z5Q2_9SPHI|nr:polysaccharide deacetylase family protein [Sphingobacterium bovistauri]MCA5005503.1 polysaccharide deacetylase family protein [Sphingobacterium bovistauri]
MLKINEGLLTLCAITLASLSFFSCQNISNSAFGSQKIDSIVENLEVIIFDKPTLHAKWDSLRKNQLKFTVDSLNPVDKKTQKRRLKDSLRREFDKHPKHIYLTFDDGPLVGSRAIDSLARAKKIKVNAFVVGRHSAMGKYRLRDLNLYIENPLVAVYNHSYTHGYNRLQTFYSNSQKAFQDFKKNEELIKFDSKVARLPGRNIWVYDNERKIDIQNAAPTADSLFKDGYKIFGWDVEWRLNSVSGTTNVPVESIFNKIVNFMDNKSSKEPNNVVFLMHDDMFQTRSGQKLLNDLVDKLIAKGYKFEFMEDYPVKY